jgi:hypothetical protein
MNFDDNYSLHLLYKLAGKPPYPRMPSWVVPEAKFIHSYPPVHKTFVPDKVLTVKNSREFIPSKIYQLVPPPGSDPGSPDFQSGAMTTSAKEAS